MAGHGARDGRLAARGDEHLQRFVARVPVFIIVLGNALDAASKAAWRRVEPQRHKTRRRWCATIIKWDDTPISLTHFAESAVRAPTRSR